MSQESQQKQAPDTLRNLFISLAVAFGFLYIAQTFMPPPPPVAEDGTDSQQVAQNEDGSADGQSVGDDALRVPSSTDSLSAPSERGAEGSDAEIEWLVMEAPDSLDVVLGNTSPGDEGLVDGVPTIASRESPYRAALVLTNIGASIKSAYVSDHTATLGNEAPYQLLREIAGKNGKTYYSFAIEAIDVDGTLISVADRHWNFQGKKQTEQGVEASFSLTIRHFGDDSIRLIRTFVLPEQDIASNLHDFYCDIRVENLSPIDERRVTLTYRGALGVSQEAPRADDRVLAWGLRGNSSLVSGDTRTLTAVSSEGEEELFTTSGEDDSKLSWAATLNKYFTCTIVPLSSTSTWDQPVEAGNVTQLTAIDLDGVTESSDDATVQFVTQAVPIKSQRAVRFPFEIYLGAKNGDAFRSIEKYQVRNMYFQVAQNYGWCTFTWLVELMIWLLNGLYGFIGDFGVAIIILVVIVRGLLHPITKKGQVNMVRMQQRMGDFQPKIEELKKKYGNDRARLNSETMKLYREEGISPAAPLLGCLPMLLQMPIWIALFISLSNNILMRHEGFLFTWIDDLTGQDALIPFSSPFTVPLLGAELTSFNLLPILVAISMYVQQKLQPKPKPNPNMSEQQIAQQEMMQKMMPMMSIMMLVFFYKMPAGLNLYIMTSSFFGALEQAYIRSHIRKHEDEGTLHKPSKANSSKGPSIVQRYVQRLQDMAEEAQKQQQAGGGGKGPRMKDMGGKKGRKGPRR